MCNKIVLRFMCKSFLITLLFFIIKVSLTSDRTIEKIRISDNNQKGSVRVVFDLNEKVPYTSFTLDKNPRLVVDLEADQIKKLDKLKSSKVKKIRIRKTEKGVIRVVFDLKESFYIEKNFYLEKGEYFFYRLVIDLKINLKVKERKVNNKSDDIIITIDPGHGGIDPGAVKNNVNEKDITLKAAKELEIMLKKYGYKVYLTRRKDKFVPLRKRRELANKYQSDLFISLHVDSVKKKSTRGTSIYTLSNKASDKITAMLAERENKADLIAGINLDKVDNEVASILPDLKRRDTKNSSVLFAEKYVNYIRKEGHRLLRRPHRHAGFAVLKSANVPSVLIELGFLSSKRDVRFLTNKNQRLRLLETLAKAIKDYVESKRKTLTN